MKQTNNPRRGRGRAPQKKNNGRHSAGNRTEQKVRGNPKQHLEKYKTLAREASQAGERIAAENYYQFADHYQRLFNDMRPKAHEGDRKPKHGGDGDQPSVHDGKQKEVVLPRDTSNGGEQDSKPDTPSEANKDGKPDNNAAGVEQAPRPKRRPARPKAKPDTTVGTVEKTDEVTPQGDTAA